jgi:hypothetical protein
LLKSDKLTLDWVSATHVGLLDMSDQSRPAGP